MLASAGYRERTCNGFGHVECWHCDQTIPFLSLYRVFTRVVNHDAPPRMKKERRSQLRLRRKLPRRGIFGRDREREGGKFRRQSQTEPTTRGGSSATLFSEETRRPFA